MNEIKFLTRTTFEVAKAGLAVSGLIFLGLGAVVIGTGFLGTVSLGVGILTSVPGHLNVIAFTFFGGLTLASFVCVLIMGQMIDGAINTVKWMMDSASAPVRKLGELFDAVISQYLPAGATATAPH